MPSRLLAGVFFICVGFTALCAEGHFHLNAQIEEVYEQIIHLRFEEAEEAIQIIKEGNPENLLIYHVENYIDFFKVFIGESETDLRTFEINKDIRLQKLKEGNKSSPYYNFCQAEVLLQWALARAKFDETIRAGWDINKAYKLLVENEKRFPDFELNKKSLSIIHTMIGSIKGLKKGLIKVFTSLSGSVSQGVGEMDELYNWTFSSHSMFNREVWMIRAMTALHIEDDEDKAYALIDLPGIRHTQSPLIDFIRATIALRSGHTVEGIAILEKAKASSTFPFHFLDFLLGREKLNRLEPGAKKHLIDFVQSYSGKNYLKEAYQKLAWYEWAVKGDEKGYFHWLQYCLSEGQTLIGEDEAALQEGMKAILPHRMLLRARLLFDGEDYKGAKETLESIDLYDLPPADQLEYQYRMARVHQMMGQWENAIHHFGYVLHNRFGEATYFRCSAALQMARITAVHLSCRQALRYTDLCLDISPEFHGNSLHQKARILRERIREGVMACNVNPERS